MNEERAELAGELPALFSRLVLHLEKTGGVGLGLSRVPVELEQSFRILV